METSSLQLFTDQGPARAPDYSNVKGLRTFWTWPLRAKYLIKIWCTKEEASARLSSFERICEMCCAPSAANSDDVSCYGSWRCVLRVLVSAVSFWFPESCVPMQTINSPIVLNEFPTSEFSKNLKVALDIPWQIGLKGSSKSRIIQEKIEFTCALCFPEFSENNTNKST